MQAATTFPIRTTGDQKSVAAALSLAWLVPTIGHVITTICLGGSLLKELWPAKHVFIDGQSDFANPTSMEESW